MMRHFDAKDNPVPDHSLSQITPAIDEVLEGNLNSFDSLQPELKALLTKMKALAPQNTIDPIMTITHFRDGMKKVPEGKSSSLSGRNYSIYKAMLPDNYYTGKVVELINKGVTYGFLLKRWRKVLQVMLSARNPVTTTLTNFV